MSWGKGVARGAPPLMPDIRMVQESGRSRSSETSGHGPTLHTPISNLVRSPVWCASHRCLWYMPVQHARAPQPSPGTYKSLVARPGNKSARCCTVVHVPHVARLSILYPYRRKACLRRGPRDHRRDREGIRPLLSFGLDLRAAFCGSRKSMHSSRP